MLTKERLDFILRLTDWFHGHYEDQDWGRRDASQILVSLAVRELATGIHDAEVRAQIQRAADAHIAKHSMAMTKA